MIHLSVNINKIATIRNARGGRLPDVTKFAIDCQQFGADGITVHPRPDERHITLNDVYSISEHITTEFNIEGYPDKRFMKMIQEIKPHQATLVPDPPDVLTSNNGWNIKANQEILLPIIDQLKTIGTRVSLFVNPNHRSIIDAADIGVDRIELYTGPFAEEFVVHPKKAVQAYTEAAKTAGEVGLEVNAGHDLSLENLSFFKDHVRPLSEVSIGHAIISDALYFGIEDTIKRYKSCL
tara:strand:- start:343 stop:1053 length:711 start_codon:yes stop_codon:yes gene_type:complete